MSHFTTIVVVREATDAKDAERQAEEALAPFSENLEVPHEVWGETRTSVVEEATWWRNYNSVSDEDKAKYEAEDPEPADKESSAWHEWAMRAITKQENGTPIFDQEKGYGYISTYNPKSKWDWYALGGRWHNYFPLKNLATAEHLVGSPGLMGSSADTGQADGVQKREIDFETAREDARVKANKTYDLVDQLVAEHGTEGLLKWADLVKKAEAQVITWDQARADYRAHPLVQAFNQHYEHFGFGGGPEEFFVTDPNGRERYVTMCTNRALVPFSVLLDGEFYEKGQMGWWGMVADEKEQEVWNEQVAKLFDELPDEAWLLLYDLHI